MTSIPKFYIRLMPEEREAFCQWAHDENMHPADMAAALLVKAMSERVPEPVAPWRTAVTELTQRVHALEHQLRHHDHESVEVSTPEFERTTV